MTQYKILNEKLSNLRLNKSRSGKNGTEETLKLSSNIVDSSNDEFNFSRTFLLTNTQVSKIRKASTNGSTVNIKFSKSQLSKMVQLGDNFRAQILVEPL